MENHSLSDPINFFPVEITLNIFEFLNGKDLLNASLVSTDWYDLIADTRKCMKKIIVNLKCCVKKGPSPEDIKVLANSGRQYENLAISGCKKCIIDAEPLITAPDKMWKYVKFNQASFTRISQAMFFLECIEKSVEELIILGGFIIKNQESLKSNFTFPKLKALTISNIDDCLYEDALESVQNLESLYIENLSLPKESLKALEKILIANDKLVVLGLCGTVFNQIMIRNIVPDLKFKLRRLSVRSHYDSDSSKTIQDNLVSLLKAQCRTLESVKLGDWSGLDALKTIYQLPKLKTLTMKGLDFAPDSIDWENIDLPKNSSIIGLKLRNVPQNPAMLKVITESAPKLTTIALKVPRLNRCSTGYYSDFLNHLIGFPLFTL